MGWRNVRLTFFVRACLNFAQHSFEMFFLRMFFRYHEECSGLRNKEEREKSWKRL